MTIPTVMLPVTLPPTVFLTYNNLVLGFSDIAPGLNLGSFRFLKDHYVFGEYVFAGEIRTMVTPWTPTADVEPLDAVAANNFYIAGPKLGGVWRTIFSVRPIAPPVTYWRALSPNVWGLTGLGAARAPINAIIERIEDKEV